jgi:hypothetical protein
MFYGVCLAAPLQNTRKHLLLGPRQRDRLFDVSFLDDAAAPHHLKKTLCVVRAARPAYGH